MKKKFLLVTILLASFIGMLNLNAVCTPSPGFPCDWGSGGNTDSPKVPGSGSGSTAEPGNLIITNAVFIKLTLINKRDLTTPSVYYLKLLGNSSGPMKMFYNLNENGSARVCGFIASSYNPWCCSIDGSNCSLVKGVSSEVYPFVVIGGQSSYEPVSSQLKDWMQQNDWKNLYDILAKLDVCSVSDFVDGGKGVKSGDCTSGATLKAAFDKIDKNANPGLKHYLVIAEPVYMFQHQPGGIAIYSTIKGIAEHFSSAQESRSFHYDIASMSRHFYLTAQDEEGGHLGVIKRASDHFVGKWQDTATPSEWSILASPTEGSTYNAWSLDSIFDIKLTCQKDPDTGQWYGKDGTEVTFEEAAKQCFNCNKPYDSDEDGNPDMWFDNNGKQLADENEYKKVCLPCKQPSGDDDKYHGPNGEELEGGYDEWSQLCTCVDDERGKYLQYPDKPVTTPEDEERYNEICEEPPKCPPEKIEYHGEDEDSEFPQDCEKDGSEGVIEDPPICNIIDRKSSEYDYKKEYGNTYCQVYCRETLKFTFMDKEEATAGRFFQHDVDSNYIKDKNYLSTVVLSSRQCTSDINYEKWKSDYIAANKAVLDAWNEYKFTEARANNQTTHTHASVTCEAKSCTDCCNCKTETSCTDPSDPDTCSSHEVCSAGSYSGETLSAWNWYEWKEADYQKTLDDGTEVKANADGSSGSDTYSCGTACSPSSSKGEGTPASINSQPYDDAVAARDELIKQIQDCNYVEGSDTYKEIMKSDSNDEDNKDKNGTSGDDPNVCKPTFGITYDENSKYGEGYDIDIETGQSDKVITKRGYSLEEDWDDYCTTCDNDLSGLSSTNNTEHLTYWVCSGSEMSAECHDDTSKLFPKNNVANVVIEQETYAYQSTKFSVQVYSGNISSSTGGGGYWIPLGEATWPVHALRSSGTYGIYVDYNCLGHPSRKDKGVAFEPGEFTCAYEVINDLNLFDCSDDWHSCYECVDNPYTSENECGNNQTGTNIGVYFRSIDLSDVFPNSQYSPNYIGNGTGTRPIGYNWAIAGNIIDDIQKKASKMWTSEIKPMYSITLSPGMLKEIKKYNDNHKYSDDSLVCNSLYCESTFLNDYLQNDVLRDKASEYYYKNPDIDSIYNYRG